MTTTNDTALTPSQRRDLTAAQVTEAATRIRITDQRNYLTFPTLDRARQAAKAMRAAGLPVWFLGGNQPVLTTTSDRFAAKGAQ